MRYGIPEINKHFNSEISIKTKMGFFGADTQTVAVNQAANGTATADITTKLPIWEIIVIMTAISTLVYAICACGTRMAKKQFEKSILRAAVQQV
jgi:hypothetical protein